MGTGTAVIAGLILYYIFGIGKHSNDSKGVYKNNEQLRDQWDSRRSEYEIELESFRNDMVRRGLAHTSIRKNGEAGLRAKFGIKDPESNNEARN